MYKAILIDSVNKEVREVEVTGGLKNIYKLLDCTLIEAGTYLGSDCIYVDEEGVIAGKENGFTIDDQLFVGSGLLVGTDEQGNSVSPLLSKEALNKKVKFFDITEEMEVNYV